MLARVLKWISTIGILVAVSYLFIFGVMLFNDVLHLRAIARLETTLGNLLTDPGMTYRWEAGMYAIWELAVLAGLLLCVSLLARAVARALLRRAARRAAGHVAV